VRLRVLDRSVARIQGYKQLHGPARLWNSAAFCSPVACLLHAQAAVPPAWPWSASRRGAGGGGPEHVTKRKARERA
jgi:hypothetical protein